MGRSTVDIARLERDAKIAWLYLRVSTPSQVHTDYDPEGNSIPAQRRAGQRKAIELRATVAREFVEPGRTATNIDKRPTFQEMLSAVRAAAPAERPDYIVVYHFNRIFRNSIDAAITKKELAKYSVRIVSTILDMGEGPESAMVESIIHAVDQYQSQASGSDIRYKMSQKARNGGTVGQAKLGYLNIREPKPEGGEIRTIALDPDRAPLVRQGFELFATGQYTARQVLDRLTTAGLTTRPGRPGRGKTVTLTHFYSMLADRYYTGVITYEGEQFPGRHEPLIDVELFDRVQRVLALRGGGGTRARQHHHYLKGLLWCGRCRARLIITPGRGNGGTYFYFICRARQTRACDLGYLKVHEVEAAVEHHFATARLGEEFRAQVHRQLDDTVLTELDGITSLKRRLTARLTTLDTKEDSYLDLIGDPDWPQDKIKAKIAALRAERTQIDTQLAETTATLDTGRRYFLAALDLLTDPQAMYRHGSDDVKHALAKVIFTKLYIDQPAHHARDVQIVRDNPPAGLSTLLQAQAHHRGRHHTPATAGTPDRPGNGSSPGADAGAADLERASDEALLTLSLSGQGSSRAPMVGDTGIEPVTSSV